MRGAVRGVVFLPAFSSPLVPVLGFPFWLSTVFCRIPVRFRPHLAQGTLMKHLQDEVPDYVKAMHKLQASCV